MASSEIDTMTPDQLKEAYRQHNLDVS
jgi:hypothetical protein